MSTMITFCDSDNNTVQISKDNLENYPESLLSMMAFSNVGSDRSKNIRISCHGWTLEMIAEFYEFGIWRNPYLHDNQMKIDGIMEGFDAACEYLGLPSEPFDDGDQQFYEEDEWDDPTLCDELTWNEYKEIKKMEKEETRFYEGMINEPEEYDWNGQ